MLNRIFNVRLPILGSLCSNPSFLNFSSSSFTVNLLGPRTLSIRGFSSNNQHAFKTEPLPPLRSSKYSVLRSRATVYEQGICHVCHGPKCKTNHSLQQSSSTPASQSLLSAPYYCPSCGLPTHCSRECFDKDTHHTPEVCAKLAQIIRDDEYLLDPTNPRPALPARPPISLMLSASSSSLSSRHSKRFVDLNRTCDWMQFWQSRCVTGLNQHFSSDARSNTSWIQIYFISFQFL